MPSSDAVRFTDRELDIMTVLWEKGDSTVAEVREALGDPLAYTTVLTILRILEEKGYVGHQEEGRAHRYHPLVARKVAGQSALKRLVDGLFGGSPELLMAELVDEREVPEETLRRLRELLDRKLEDEP